MKKSLTYDDVKDVVSEILKTADSVTTLEIKLILRNAGFHATQTEVSGFMQQLVQERFLDSLPATNWELYSPIMFYDYFLTDEDDTNDPLTPSIVLVGNPVLTSPQAGDWCVFSYSDPARIVYMDGRLDRNAARAHYERTEGVAYNDVGCSRVK